MGEDAAFAISAEQGSQRLVYLNELKHGRFATDQRLRFWTFEEFARKFPEDCIMMHFLERERGQDVLGQQKAFLDYLHSVGFVGRIWQALGKNEPHLKTFAKENRVSFDSDVCSNQLPGGHSRDCHAHGCCICNLTEEEARTQLKVNGQLCWPQPFPCAGRCLCTPSFEHVQSSLEWLDTNKIDSLSSPKVEHWAFALGMVRIKGEFSTGLGRRARIYIWLHTAESIWSRKAVATLSVTGVSNFDQGNEDAKNDLLHLAQLNGWGRSKGEGGLAYFKRVRKICDMCRSAVAKKNLDFWFGPEVLVPKRLPRWHSTWSDFDEDAHLIPEPAKKNKPRAWAMLDLAEVQDIGCEEGEDVGGAEDSQSQVGLGRQDIDSELNPIGFAKHRPINILVVGYF